MKPPTSNHQTPTARDSVLDLCCGTGLVALGATEAVGANGRVVGVDLSQGMLDQVGWKL